MKTRFGRWLGGKIGWMFALWLLGAVSLPADQLSSAEQRGVASFYAHKYHGRPTASGEIFDMNKLTAAHPNLPFGTVVKVTNLENSLSVIVRINDRGPFVANRVIDLSLAAARELKMEQAGLAQVKIEIVR